MMRIEGMAKSGFKVMGLEISVKCSLKPQAVTSSDVVNKVVELLVSNENGTDLENLKIIGEASGNALNRTVWHLLSGHACSH